HRSTVAINDGRRWRTTVDCRWTTVDHRLKVVGGPVNERAWVGSGAGPGRVCHVASKWQLTWIMGLGGSRTRTSYCLFFEPRTAFMNLVLLLQYMMTYHPPIRPAATCTVPRTPMISRQLPLTWQPRQHRSTRSHRRSTTVNAASHRSTAADHGGDRRSTVAVNDGQRRRPPVNGGDQRRYVNTGQRRSRWLTPLVNDGQRHRSTTVNAAGHRSTAADHDGDRRSTTVADDEPPWTAAGPPLTTTGPPVNGGCYVSTGQRRSRWLTPPVNDGQRHRSTTVNAAGHRSTAADHDGDRRSTTVADDEPPWTAAGPPLTTTGPPVNGGGVGHFARNCIVRPRRRDAVYLQTELMIAQKEEAGIQLQAEFDLMAGVADLDEIKEVNANYILMANLQQAFTSGNLTIDCNLLYASPSFDEQW
nr:Gag-Pol polyprotein [Tanacetum cinerariifolium]